MTGRYIRKKQDGPRDPTMTHVEDPSVFQVGDCVRDYKGWSVITAIDGAVFGDPTTRFIHLRELPSSRIAVYDELLSSRRAHAHRLYDFRPHDAANSGMGRAEFESALREHMTGFVE